MSQRQGINRIVAILKRLDSGEILNITKLSLEYEVSKRTVQRDFELLKELFGNFLKKENENYKAYEKIILKNILNSVELMTLANIINLFGISSLDTLATNEVNELIKSSMSVYSFRVRPFELIQDKETLKSIEHAIKFHKKIKLKYKSIDKVLMKIFSPYKILFINENFYIVGLNNSKPGF